MTLDAVSTDTMRILELNAEWLGISLGTLMENAGREVARVIEQREKPRGKKVVILCGLGGNGGDGFVAARHLLEAGASVEVYVLGSSKNFSSPDTAANWKVLQNLHDIFKQELLTERDVKECRAIQEADILVDAMLGFTLKSRVREPILTAIKSLKTSKARKYAVDIPSGIDADTGTIHGAAVVADVTVTMHAAKYGVLAARQNVGELAVAAIGIPPEAARTCGPGDVWLFNRPRRTDSKKGDFGRVLVVGGSDVYSGAPALTGMAALRTGADLVSIMAPEPVVNAIRSYSPNLMVTSLGTRVLTSENLDAITRGSKMNDVIALGPGLGQEAATYEAARVAIKSILDMGKRMVIDADGLKSLSGSGIRLDPARCIVTPHWGELQILLQSKASKTDDIGERAQAAMSAASKYNSVVLLKGPIDVIAHPEGFYKLNRTGVPAMTVGGTGDVLTGIAAALLARGRTAMEAASAAAFISGRAGEAAFCDIGDHIAATDCIERIPDAMSPVAR